MKSLILLFLSFNSYALDLVGLPKIQNHLNIDASALNMTQDMQMKVESLKPVIVNVSQSLNVNPELILSISWTESHFKSQAKSRKGAKGLMQLLPSTRKYLHKKMKYEFNKLYSLNLNSSLSYHELEDIILGTYYVNKLLVSFNDNIDYAIMAYNMGPTWVNTQLKQKRVIGNNNDYLNKVKKKMRMIASR